MRPRIAVPIPTSIDRSYNEQNWPVYATCLDASGAEPVPIPLDLPGDELRNLVSGCRGICLTGSPADVDPARYGHARDDASAPADAARERVDWMLLEESFLSKKPLLGICFGLQSLNVFLGGTLVQDLAPMPVNHAAGPSVGVSHTVAVAAGSLLASMCSGQKAESETFRIPANSSHHQAVGMTGRGLRITGRCPQDGVVEALELQDGGEHPFLLGVQWHPERSFAMQESQRMFGGLVAAARCWD